MKTAFILVWIRGDREWGVGVYETRERAAECVAMVLDQLHPGFADAYRIDEALIEPGYPIPVTFTGPALDA